MGIRAHSETPGTKLCQVAGLSTGPPRRACLIRKAKKCHRMAAWVREVDLTRQRNHCACSSSHGQRFGILFHTLFTLSVGASCISSISDLWRVKISEERLDAQVPEKNPSDKGSFCVLNVQADENANDERMMRSLVIDTGSG